MKGYKKSGLFLVVAITVAFLYACGGGGGGGGTATPTPTPTEPTVRTEVQIIDSTNTSAMLNGSVKPGGLDIAKIEFQWKLNDDNFESSYETAAATPYVLSAGGSDTPVSANISVSCGNIVYFRLVAVDSSGREKASTPSSFSLCLAAPVVRNLSFVPKIDDTEVVLKGTVNPNYLDTNYWFEYSTDNFAAGGTEFGNDVIGGSEGSRDVEVAATFNSTVLGSPLAEGAIYSFRLVAKNTIDDDSKEYAQFKPENVVYSDEFKTADSVDAYDEVVSENAIFKWGENEKGQVRVETAGSEAYHVFSKDLDSPIASGTFSMNFTPIVDNENSKYSIFKIILHDASDRCYVILNFSNLGEADSYNRLNPGIHVFDRDNCSPYDTDSATTPTLGSSAAFDTAYVPDPEGFNLKVTFDNDGIMFDSPWGSGTRLLFETTFLPEPIVRFAIEVTEMDADLDNIKVVKSPESAP